MAEPNGSAMADLLLQPLLDILKFIFQGTGHKSEQLAVAYMKFPLELGQCMFSAHKVSPFIDCEKEKAHLRPSPLKWKLAGLLIAEPVDEA